MCVTHSWDHKHLYDLSIIYLFSHKILQIIEKRKTPPKKCDLNLLLKYALLIEKRVIFWRRIPLIISTYYCWWKYAGLTFKALLRLVFMNRKRLPMKQIWCVFYIYKLFSSSVELDVNLDLFIIYILPITTFIYFLHFLLFNLIYDESWILYIKVGMSQLLAKTHLQSLK